MNIDLQLSFALVSLTIIGILAYVIRAQTKGRAQFDRIDREGSSVLLSKDVMTMGYWWFVPIGQFCAKFGISANQISWLSFFCGAVTAVSIAMGHFGIAACFFLAAGFLDVVDGMVARMQDIKDPAGEILDSSLDRYVDFLLFAGLLIYYRDSIILISITMLAMLGSFMISYSSAKAEAMQLKPPRGAMKRGERVVYLIGALIFTPISIAYLEDTLAFTPHLALPLLGVVTMIAVAANVSAVNRLRALAKAARDRAAQQ